MGYYAARARVPMTVSPIEADSAHPDIGLRYAIAMAVPPGHELLRNELQSFLRRRAYSVRRLLADYHVPSPEPPSRHHRDAASPR
jgi:hypothetical protein